MPMSEVWFHHDEEERRKWGYLPHSSSWLEAQREKRSWSLKLQWKDNVKEKW
jgi:hypothetical protein